MAAAKPTAPKTQDAKATNQQVNPNEAAKKVQGKLKRGEYKLKSGSVRKDN